MSSAEISEDEDDSFDPMELDQLEKQNSTDVIIISSGEETDNYYTSDEDNEVPAVDLTNKKSAVIKNLFSTSKFQANNNKNNKCEPSTSHHHWLDDSNSVAKPSTTSTSNVTTLSLPPPKPKDPGFEMMMGGVKINLPVNPYSCQKALMFKVITAIKEGKNCLLESPTGSGKTLALLCGALAWLQHEKNRIAQIQAQQYFTHHPELSSVAGVTDYIASPIKSNSYSPVKGKYSTPTKDSPAKGCATPGKGSCTNIPGEENCVNFDTLFKSVWRGRSIYDSPSKSDVTDDACCNKRQEPLQDSSEESPTHGQVTIHKRRKLNSSASGEGSSSKPISPLHTPEKPIVPTKAETPEKVNLPTIYYGARTHKQIQQVVKEFSRTWYCGEALMTILSSRDHSCIREFDKKLWGTKNDMCRGCIKKLAPGLPDGPKKNETNCAFYDNRQALDHRGLPPAFDLEDLVAAGEELKACPYYAARAMAQVANIVFCPYNYLIEPGIRNSMQIDLRDNIVIIDEGHNIEDICRDAATFTFTRDTMQAAIKELEVASNYRYANHDMDHYLNCLLRTLKSWDDWFANQMPLTNNKPVNNNEAVHMWQVDHFVQTLNNHNIGEQQYNDFTQSAEMFCKRFREDPRALYGVTQITATLVESLDTVLGYLFRESGKYKDDFKPALIRTVYGSPGGISESKGWRSSQFNQWVDKETLSLRLMCMNPAVIFASLKTAKCILLASGTLTPLISLHSELATEFPLKISPDHVVSSDRVWIGTLTTCPKGRKLECNSKGTDQLDVQDGIGEAVLWVSQVTPHGVLCFLPSYMLMNKLYKRWQETGLWSKLNDSKHVFMESRNSRDHNDIMDDYYKYVSTNKGALLFAVYRGKVSEGMDFKDHQARAVITIGVPYPNTFDMAVKEKMIYNDKYAAERKLLSSREWLRVQAYRALNQAVGRCVRHRNDWGAVLLIDARFRSPYYTEHLSKWVRNFLGNNHHTYETLVNSTNSLESFMQNMTIRENEEM